MSAKFEILGQDGRARRGVLHTAHGDVQTPAFMPVGTAATVKGLMPDQVAQTGADILLGNTYHLMLRPGADRVESFGGLHRFMAWEKPILTDSGGFQVMSLAGLRTIDEDGVTFRAHTDGSSHRLTPETAMDIQRQLDSDITMVLDECISYPAEKDTALESMRRSMRWAERCRKSFVERPGYGLFGIVQGGIYDDLRAESVDALQAMNFDGLAVGGLAVGEGQTAMLSVLDGLAPVLPPALPHYLMGVGTPDDIVKAVARGIDMFDCVLPTRSGRTGRGYSRTGHINIKNARHAVDAAPLVDGCACPTCNKFSRGYLHHLFRCGEMLGPILLTLHNLFFYQQLMAEIREAIASAQFATFLENWNIVQDTVETT